jgi:hypothetical protein
VISHNELSRKFLLDSLTLTNIFALFLIEMETLKVLNNTVYKLRDLAIDNKACYNDWRESIVNYFSSKNMEWILQISRQELLEDPAKLYENQKVFTDILFALPEDMWIEVHKERHVLMSSGHNLLMWLDKRYGYQSQKKATGLTYEPLSQKRAIRPRRRRNTYKKKVWRVKGTKPEETLIKARPQSRKKKKKKKVWVPKLVQTFLNGELLSNWRMRELKTAVKLSDRLDKLVKAAYAEDIHVPLMYGHLLLVLKCNYVGQESVEMIFNQDVKKKYGLEGKKRQQEAKGRKEVAEAQEPTAKQIELMMELIEESSRPIKCKKDWLTLKEKFNRFAKA